MNTIGITELTPIQKDVVENYKSYNELIVYSPTGSGKTLAFLLPLIDLLDKDSSDIQALIISPTRELALQIESVFKSLKTDFLATSCYGGHSIKTEIANLSANPAVVIGTPGRIEDHLNRRNIFLKETTVLIVDEFDKCLELGFQVEIEKIYNQLRNLNKAFYSSATRIDEFPSFINMKNSIVLDQLVEDSQPDIQFFKIQATKSKLGLLADAITQFNNEPTIVFCNFRDDVDGVFDYLTENDFCITSYHGRMEQDERERSLIKFRNGSCPVLICTDLGSRGLDIPEVKHIIHFQLPDKEDAFTHRNGRTARMQKNGNVYLFEEEFKDSKIELPKCAPLKIRPNSDYNYPEFTTVYFSGGKKDKINKIDLLGFICQKGGVTKNEVGMISVLDTSSFVALKSEFAHSILGELRNHKIKGKKLKIAISE